MESYFSGSSFVDELQPKDFDDVATWKLKSKKCTLVLFYAPWCPHCKAVKDVWIQLGKTAGFCDIASFNCEKYSGHLDKIRNDMPNLVKSFPTIIMYKNRNPTEVHSGKRTLESFLDLCMRCSK